MKNAILAMRLGAIIMAAYNNPQLKEGCITNAEALSGATMADYEENGLLDDEAMLALAKVGVSYRVLDMFNRDDQFRLQFDEAEARYSDCISTGTVWELPNLEGN